MIETTVEGRVAFVTLDRPGRRNALTNRPPITWTAPFVRVA
jgi:enoyl-CoA hydratase/carnithine racemase